MLSYKLILKISCQFIKSKMDKKLQKKLIKMTIILRVWDL